jgi:hypothetical protein
MISAINQAKTKSPDLLYTVDWLAGICVRETGQIIAKYPNGRLIDVSAITRGDFSKRDHDTEAVYHGYGFWQIDIDSFPAFVKAGDWKDPAKTCVMAISVLEDKRKYIQEHFPALAGDDLARAITAAYNCGEGNVVKVLTAKEDIDAKTTGADYSKAVWGYREMYQSL